MPSRLWPGGPLSPLLANIYLDALDKELDQRGHCYCRYADDCNIYVSSQAAAGAATFHRRQWLGWKQVRSYDRGHHQICGSRTAGR